MRDVQIIRGAVTGHELEWFQNVAGLWKFVTEWGTYQHARIYDDLWPLNISGIEGVGLPYALRLLIEKYLGDNLDMMHSIILCTTHYPHKGMWHRDAPPYEDDTICLLCVNGYDELEYHYGDGRWRKFHGDMRHEFTGDCATQHADLFPGDLCLLPAATWHRAKCTTHRITWHVRVGPQGKSMPESPPAILPPMTLRRFIRRTVCTACYYLIGNSTPWRKS